MSSLPASLPVPLPVSLLCFPPTICRQFLQTKHGQEHIQQITNSPNRIVQNNPENGQKKNKTATLSYEGVRSKMLGHVLFVCTVRCYIESFSLADGGPGFCKIACFSIGFDHMGFSGPEKLADGGPVGSRPAPGPAGPCPARPNPGPAWAGPDRTPGPPRPGPPGPGLAGPGPGFCDLAHRPKCEVRFDYPITSPNRKRQRRRNRRRRNNRRRGRRRRRTRGIFSPLSTTCPPNIRPMFPHSIQPKQLPNAV